jgi:hypothetical protein
MSIPQATPDSYQVNQPLALNSPQLNDSFVVILMNVYQCVRDPSIVISAAIPQPALTFVPGFTPPPIPLYKPTTRFSAINNIPELNLTAGTIVIKGPSGLYTSLSQATHFISPDEIEGDSRFTLIFAP